MRLSRLALLAFIALAVLFLLWAFPWLPSGLDTNDYTPELAFTVYLMGGVALAGLLALAFRELALRNRDITIVWAAVYDEATGLHNRSYLYDRLSLECERAERNESVFSLLVLQVHLSQVESPPVPAPANALEEVAHLINRITHPGDMVALLSGRELAVLAMEADRAAGRQLLGRLREAAVSELPRFVDASTHVDVKGGAATYGVDGSDPETLVQAARSVAILAMPARSAAA